MRKRGDFINIIADSINLSVYFSCLTRVYEFSVRNIGDPRRSFYNDLQGYVEGEIARVFRGLPYDLVAIV